MKTNDDIESYLLQLDLPYQQLGDGLWIVNNGPANIVVSHTPPIVLFRVKMFEIPKQKREALYRKLLELNGQELIHGAYAIEDENVVLVEALQSENLDLNEFQASMDSLTLAVHNHREVLAPFQGAAG